MATENEEKIIYDPDNSVLPTMFAGEDRARWIASTPRPDEDVKAWRITMEFDKRGDLKSYWEGSLDGGLVWGRGSLPRMSIIGS